MNPAGNVTLPEPRYWVLTFGEHGSGLPPQFVILIVTGVATPACTLLGTGLVTSAR